MRNIAKFSGANVVGVNNNDYQIRRGTCLNIAAGLDKQCSFHKADFMSLRLEPGTADAAYAIEATCHAPDRKVVFKNVYDALKKGGKFAVYEWVTTDK